MEASKKELWILDGGFFYCALEVENGIVVQAAPIVRYMLGWRLEQAKSYAHKRGWNLERLKP